MATYKIDPAHSEIVFKVRHLMITNVTGHFKTFDASMDSNASNFSDAKIHFEADVDSIFTNQEQRDAHLKSDDFFNAEKFPKLTFDSASITEKSEGKFLLNGDLTIRDITKPVTLTVEYHGSVTDPYGQNKSGFEIKGKVSRKEFGLLWNAVTEAGGVVAGDEVKIELNVQMIKQN
ncbi:MAG: YceI family protein [Chitinophagaceae bacterium]|nr:YceI family protein [Chitinophagaceae bacterium]